MSEEFYQFNINQLNGEEISLSKFKGKIILIVNTASYCGLTYHYTGLEKLYQDYKDNGLVIIGFPCNQFGGQEPGNDEEIQNFCTLNFGVTFPMFSKIDVNGDDAAPLYQFLTKNQPGLMGSKKIKWNFTKFLINSKGEPIARFGSSTKPEKIANKIAEVLD